jgi:CheY-like chemotaxis protein
LRALLVDDNDEFLASAGRLLESQGIEVVGYAKNGSEALRLARGTRTALRTRRHRAIWIVLLLTTP